MGPLIIYNQGILGDDGMPTVRVPAYVGAKARNKEATLAFECITIGFLSQLALAGFPPQGSCDSSRVSDVSESGMFQTVLAFQRLMFLIGLVYVWGTGGAGVSGGKIPAVGK